MSIVLCIVFKENQLISISRSKITQNIRNMQENYDFCMNFYDFWSKVVQKKRREDAYGEREYDMFHSSSFLNSSRIYAGLWKYKPVSGFESASNVRELQKASIASRIDKPLSSIRRATTSRVSDSIINDSLLIVSLIELVRVLFRRNIASSLGDT